MCQEWREIGPLGEVERERGPQSRQTRVCRRGGAHRGLAQGQLLPILPLASRDQVGPLLLLLLDDRELGLGRAQVVLGTGLLRPEIQNVANGKT